MVEVVGSPKRGRLKGVMTFVSTWCRPGVEMFEGEIALQTWIQELGIGISW